MEHYHNQNRFKRATRLLVNSLDFCIKRSVCGGTEGRHRTATSALPSPCLIAGLVPVAARDAVVDTRGGPDGRQQTEIEISEAHSEATSRYQARVEACASKKDHGPEVES